MKKTVSFVLLILLTVTVQAQIYKWTDAQGNVHFSDKPHQGAEQIELPEVQTFSPPARPQTQDDSQQQAEDESDLEQEIIITQPENQATIRNNQGLVTVSVEVKPALQAGEQLQMIFDGQKLGAPQTMPNFIINNVYRGSHTIAIERLDADGKVVMTSKSITIFMHRPRVGMVPGTRAKAN